MHLLNFSCLLISLLCSIIPSVFLNLFPISLLNLLLSIPTNPPFPIMILCFYHLPPVPPSPPHLLKLFLVISLHPAYATHLVCASFSSHLHIPLYCPSCPVVLFSVISIPWPYTPHWPPPSFSSLSRLQTHYFGLWFQGKTQAPAHRWVELEKPLKKQLDKFGNEPLLFFGVMFYVPNVSRLEQEATR